MTIFTDHWTHTSFSPSKLNETQDFHTDGNVMLIVPAGDVRPEKDTPPKVAACAIVKATLSAGDIAGMIDVAELMARLRDRMRHDINLERAVIVDNVPFDALKLWDFCVAVLGTGPIGWRINKLEIGAELFLFGTEWRGCVMSMREGTGPQVLP